MVKERMTDTAFITQSSFLARNQLPIWLCTCIKL